jgi:hypothetical protein
MKVFQQFIQSTRLFAKALFLRLVITRLQIRIRLCNCQLLVFPKDTNTIGNLQDARWGYQIEAQSLSVRVHRVMAARKLEAQSAQDRIEEQVGQGNEWNPSK